jgi:hypothetical protein
VRFLCGIDGLETISNDNKLIFTTFIHEKNGVTLAYSAVDGHLTFGIAQQQYTIRFCVYVREGC